MEMTKVIRFPSLSPWKPDDTKALRVVEVHAPKIKSIYENIYKDQVRTFEFEQIIRNLHEKMNQDVNDFDPQAWRKMQWMVYLPLAFVIGFAVGM